MLVLSDNVILLLNKLDLKWKLSTWGMISSVDNIKRNMETKEISTLVWNTNIESTIGTFMDDLPDEQLEELEEKKKVSETMLHVVDSDLLMEKILSKKANIIE